MRLVFAYPPGFRERETIVKGITRYFPDLIEGHSFAESQTLARFVRAEDIDRIVERAVGAQIDWKTDIIFAVFSGPIYAYEELLLDNCAGTLQAFTEGQERSLPNVPKIGGYYNIHGIRALNLEDDTKFLVKLAAEEILHIFDVPKEHDRCCFFHPERHPSAASCGNEFCPKCRALMNALVEPLEFGAIFQFVDDLYGKRLPL